ncbi:signal recognition particle, SRP9/SRP14 subunit [Gaertneriomyces semiglobifer]|nr:signal recognition particle, SRP9/SRP14 subunit [Gaertneriomyces semiglobifer]
MVYIEAWEDFQRAVEDLYESDPVKTRYVSKYRHTEGVLVLKVDNGPTCIKFKTDRQQDLKKFERLNLSLMLKMHAVPELAEESLPATTEPTPMDITPDTIPTSQAPSRHQGGAVKKGKGKKRGR